MVMPKVSGKRFLLITGLGHTDLSGKVPRPGLLMLRKALRAAGHDAAIANYSTSHMGQLFPQPQVDTLSRIYNRSVRPFVIEGQSPARNPLAFLRFLAQDMPALKRTTRALAEVEQKVFAGIAHDLVRQVKQENFDAVGFSLFLGSSTIGSITIADTLRKEIPDLPIIFGGPQTTHFAETIYRETQAPTALVLGEGEIAIREIANILDALKAGRLDDLSKIPNIVYRRSNGKIIATPRRRLSLEEWAKISAVPYEPGDFDGLLKYAFIETSRGCKYQCRFCPQPLLSGANRYLKPEAQIVDEMVDLNTRFGIAHFELVGSSTPQSQAEAIALELIRRGLKGKFKWVLFMRGKDEGSKTNIFEKMKTIKSAGCSAAFFGVEAADNKTLRKMGKGGRVEEAERSMRAAKGAGIATIGSFIYPYPGMPENEADLIVKFLERTMPLSAPVQALGLLPGTYASNNAEAIGCQVIYPNRDDQRLFILGKKPKPTMKSPEILSYLLKYPLMLSLPMRFWQPLPYKIDGQSFKQYIKAVNALQRRIGKLGILTGFSHSHHLIAEVLGMPPNEFSERLFYCGLTGDPTETGRLIEKFNNTI